MSRLRLTFSGGTLVLEGADRSGLPGGLVATDWTWDARVGAWRADAIVYAAVVERLRRSGCNVEDRVPQWEPIRWPRADLLELRAEQREAVDAWRRTGRGCVVMPTGTGKTEVALAIMASAAASTLVVAPVRDLMYQWHRRILQRLGYDAGIIGDSAFRVRPVSVTTYDSAYIHMERLGDRFGLVVFDECHHLPGPLRRDAARMSAAPMRLGLTATPQRSDGRQVDLDWLVGPIVFDMPLAKARGKTLADYEVIRIPIHLAPEEQARYENLSRQVRAFVAERRRDQPGYAWEDLCAETGKTPQARRAMKAFHAKKAIEDRAQEKLRVLEDLFRLHAAEPCLVFTGSNAMARDVSRRFLIPCLLSHCGKKERIEVLEGLERGDYPALVCNRVLDEGVDLPEVKVAIVLGGTASGRQAKQRLGRVLRKSRKARAVLYEIVSTDTTEEHRSRRRRDSDAFDRTRRRRF
ncbi:MAG: DEAD/DEAH box helicase family protein [Pirellulales bacterium]|nr:DEAD/DEAH box helicase family protein [Pirellulales bacterium]